MLDTNHAVAIIVVGALLFLVAVHQGFRGMIPQIGE